MNKASILSAVVGLALLTVPALADPITGILSIQGSNSYSNTLNTISFLPGSGTVGGVSTGTLAPFTAGNAVTLFNFNFDGSFVPGTEVFSTTQAGKTVALTLQTLTSAVTPEKGLVINAAGFLSETGFDSSPATFTLTSQDGGKDLNVVTFSATTIAATPVPEPASIALLGTGLLGFAGLMRRKLLLT